MDAFVAAIGAECYVSRDAVVEAVRVSGAFNVIHMATAVKVGIFVAGTDAFDRERLQRRRLVSSSTESDAVTLLSTRRRTQSSASSSGIVAVRSRPSGNGAT